MALLCWTGVASRAALTHQTVGGSGEASAQAAAGRCSVARTRAGIRGAPTRRCGGVHQSACEPEITGGDWASLACQVLRGTWRIAVGIGITGSGDSGGAAAIA
jgi:hypothetical protein